MPSHSRLQSLANPASKRKETNAPSLQSSAVPRENTREKEGWPSGSALAGSIASVVPGRGRDKNPDSVRGRGARKSAKIFILGVIKAFEWLFGDNIVVFILSAGTSSHVGEAGRKRPREPEGSSTKPFKKEPDGSVENRDWPQGQASDANASVNSGSSSAKANSHSTTSSVAAKEKVRRL
jgi:hypothetical protein